MNLQKRAKEVVVDNNGIAKSADFVAAGIRAVAVSYTHLDVYKRQVITIDDLKDFSDEFTEAVNFCIKTL